METSFDTHCQEEDGTPRLTGQGICSNLVLMDFENLGDVWQAGARLYVRCARSRRDGLKSVRACGHRHELEIGADLDKRQSLPDLDIVHPHALPEMRLATSQCG
jgi:hypothetical protein